MLTNTFRYTMCSAPNVYMFVYTLNGAQTVPLNVLMFKFPMLSFLYTFTEQFHKNYFLLIIIHTRHNSCMLFLVNVLEGSNKYVNKVVNICWAAGAISGCIC